MDFIQNYWIFFVLAFYLGDKLISRLNKEDDSKTLRTASPETKKRSSLRPLDSINKAGKAEVKNKIFKKPRLIFQEELKGKKERISKITTIDSKEKTRTPKKAPQETSSTAQLATKLHDKDELKRAVIYAEILKPKY